MGQLKEYNIILNYHCDNPEHLSAFKVELG
jgi:hypothetical protein